MRDDEVYEEIGGPCPHGKVAHYRYPCRRCLGWRLYLRLKWDAWRERWGF